ncbi:MAG: YihY/virulence factor BrkB family protein [Bacilli bacterium]|nr:YihY/virulence factor BrkB family protein [Bacilli bacterium]MDD3305099.1 YihY/virulence factor BrkB family protein [Bacilli bacterium]MDD4053368.1 YihY/virulence factor BrkB family protein [Bacilli bacterium]MDD4410985.1 YihY/virulence factor BrkB family protein [Bacilli bacterium]
MLKKLKMLIIEIKKIISEPIMNILPGQLAFFFLLSLPPLISLVGIIGSSFAIPTEDFISFITDSFPAATSSLIIPFVGGRGLDLGSLLFIIGACFMVSKGTNAIIVTSNALYKVEEGSEIKRQIKSLFLVFMLLILFAFILIVPAFGDLIMGALENIKYINDIFDELLFVYNIIKLPISFIFIYFIIKIIYTIAPDKEIKSRDVTFGAVFTTILWIVATKIFSYYVINFSTYDVFYGSIANFIILLLWMYLLSYIFVLGMALNAGNRSLELNSKKGI